MKASTSSPYFWSLLLLLSEVVSGLYAQPKPVSRATQWKPEQGKYYFSHVLVYEYLMKSDSIKGELRVQVDPVTGSMCFQRETSFGTTDEVNEIIVALANGKYIACGTDANGKKIRSTYINSALTPHPEDVQFQRDSFKEQCISTGQVRREFGWESAEHMLAFSRTPDKTRLWLATVPFYVYPLYAFDEWGGDAQLPVVLSYNYVLGPKQLITELDDPEVHLQLVRYENSPYVVNLTRFIKID